MSNINQVSEHRVAGVDEQVADGVKYYLTKCSCGRWSCVEDSAEVGRFRLSQHMDRERASA